jgi:hypothetical protein
VPSSVASTGMGAQAGATSIRHSLAARVPGERRAAIMIPDDHESLHSTSCEFDSSSSTSRGTLGACPCGQFGCGSRSYPATDYRTKKRLGSVLIEEIIASLVSDQRIVPRYATRCVVTHFDYRPGHPTCLIPGNPAPIGFSTGTNPSDWVGARFGGGVPRWRSVIIAPSGLRWGEECGADNHERYTNVVLVLSASWL